MLWLAAGVVLGTLLFQQLPEIPGRFWLALVLAGAAALWFPARKMPPLRLVTASLLALGWAHGYALLTEPALLPEAFLGESIRAVGQAVGLVERRPDNQRMLVDLHRLETTSGQSLQGRWRVRLSWYRNDTRVRPGQWLDLQIKLRPARGFSNPGSFDYEAWLYRQGIRYTGYVKGAHAAPRDRDDSGLDALRQRLSDEIAAALPAAESAGVLRALVVGDRSGISRAQWQVFRRTGTNHLMAISGLHIGLVAGAVAVLFGLLWRALPMLIARSPARQAGVFSGMAGALAYAALAGFSLPTQRAVIMLTLAAFGLLARRQQRWGDLYALAVILVLALDPSAALSPGFWLSFGAVGAILLVSAPTPAGGRRSRLGTAIRVQLAISLALAPALLTLGLGLPLLQVVVNLLAVPVFSVLVVPPALLGALTLWAWPEGGAALLGPVAALTDVLLAALGWVDARAGAVFVSPRPGLPAILLGICGVCLLLLPRGFPGRHLAPLLALPLVVSPGLEAPPAQGDYRVHVLDVGQGLASVVETAGHVLVFDVGPRRPSGFETGSSVVAPFLRELGRKRVDLTILSHADIDHAGGESGLLEQFPDTDTLAGEPRPGQRACVAGQRWVWDDVRFETLHPPAGHERSGNHASCVVRVENASGITLLTGDIEARSERRLVRLDSAALNADLVLAPHHGSRTSSSPEFVTATAPGFVVFTAGYRNRYGFPHPTVAGRWQAVGARLLNTAVSGQLSFSAAAGGPLRLSREHRLQSRRYWHTRQ